MNVPTSHGRRLARRAMSAIAIAAAATLAFSACSGSGGAGGDAENDVLTVVVSAAPTSLNPAIAVADSAGSWFNQLSYDP